MEINRDTTITELHKAGLISVRTFHCLDAAELWTIKDVLSFIQDDENRLLKLRNFGLKSLSEVHELLERARLEILLQRERQEKARKREEENASALQEIFAKAYSATFCGDGEEAALAKRVFPSADALREAIDIGEYDFFAIQSELGREGNIKLRHLYLEFVERVMRGIIGETDLADGPLYGRLMTLRMSLMTNADVMSFVDEVRHFVSPVQRALLERSFQNLASRLSVRAVRIVRLYLPTPEQVVPWFGKMQSEYQALCPGKTMWKTQLELYRFVEIFDSDLHLILSLPPKEALTRDTAERFPFLGKNQAEHVAQYREQYQSCPMFYILYFYLKSSDNRLIYVFSLLNGIRDGEFHSLLEAGKILQLTRERVRQLSVKELNLQETELGRHEDWEGYAPLFALPYITELSPKYRMVKEEEALPFGFDIFSRLLPLVAPFRRFQVQGKSLLVSNELLRGWDFEEVLEKMDAIFHDRYTRDTDFHLWDVAGRVPDASRDDALRLLGYIVAEAYGCPLSDDRGFTIGQNRIDVAQEIYDILYGNGRPMHLDEIFEAFKNRYPEHRYEDSRYLRPYIQKHPHILAIGNTSTYALDSWEVYAGGVRDRLREVLGQASVPLPIDEIVEKVLEVVPYTNRASILSSMDSADFVPYKQDRWGLAGKQYPDRFQRNQVGRQRKAFDERYDEFREFVETYRRFPFSTGGETEGTLFRWLNNVRNGIVTTTDKQQEAFEEMVRTFREKHYPENTSEYKCQEKCREYKEYIEANYELPTRQANEELYSWMYKMKREYNGLTENSRHYLTELFDYVRSYGFNL